jgi:hypothetical protein
VERIELRYTPGLAWWWSVWRMLDWHLGMAEGGDGRPRSRLSPADAVSLTRFWLVPALPSIAKHPTGLPVVIVLAGASDWLDGMLARRHGRTRLGRDLHTTADLAFLTVAALSARRSDRLSAPACRALVARQAIGIVLAAGAVFGRARRPAIRARQWGAPAAHRRACDVHCEPHPHRHSRAVHWLSSAAALNRKAPIARIAKHRNPLPGRRWSLAVRGEMLVAQ